MPKKFFLVVALLGIVVLCAVTLVFFFEPQPGPAPAPVTEDFSRTQPSILPAESLSSSPSDVSFPPISAPPPFAPGGPPQIPPEILARMQDPQAQARVAQSMAQGLRAMYADVLAGLSPHDAERFVQVLVQEQMSRASKLLTQGPPTAAQDIQRELRESDQRLEVAMGSDLFQTYKKNSKSLVERRLVRDFSTSVSSSGMGLTPDQTSALILLMTEQRVSARDAALKHMADPAAIPASVASPQHIMQRQRDVDAAVRATDAQVIEQARKFLSAEQVGALQFFLSSQGGMSGLPAMPPSIPSAP